LVRFLYILLRDHVTAGQVEEIMQGQAYAFGSDCEFTNGWVVLHAQDIAKRLRATEEG
jgi:hypothetical protein